MMMSFFDIAWARLFHFIRTFSAWVLDFVDSVKYTWVPRYVNAISFSPVCKYAVDAVHIYSADAW